MTEFHLDPDYVLDRMELFEIRLLMRHHDRLERGAWERARALAYIIAQTHSTKKMTPADIMALPWDNEAGGSADQTVTADERAAAIERARLMERIINGER